MKRSILYVLIASMLALGAAFVACGGGSKKSNNEQVQPTTQQQDNGQNQNQQEQATPAAKATATSGGSSSGNFADVPIYPGATEVTSGQWSGSDAGIIPSGDLDPSKYQNMQYAMYESNDSPDDVYNWYKDNMDGWDLKESFAGGSGGDYGAYALWSKDNDATVAWLTVGTSGDVTNLGIWVGTQ